ncbi:MAG: hypothetical protein HY719_04530 [Planctomycetes bacterium]|nr:hypothetical protein [Planctomycetota bacterium]
MVVCLVLAILGTIGIGVAQYALEQANQSGCASNLRNLYGAARQYESQFHVYPPRKGGLFWKTLYVAEDGFDRELDHYLCPSTADNNRDSTGVPSWTVGNFSPPQPEEVSYAGPGVVHADFKDTEALGADDDEPAGMPNHPSGLNLLLGNGRLLFAANPDSGEPLTIGVRPPVPDAVAIKDLVN